MKEARSQRTTEIIYAFTDIYFSGARSLFDLFYAYFLSQALELPLYWVGFIYSSAIIARAIAEPTAGIISDHILTRWGRRKPFFIIGIPFVFLTFLALWYPHDFSEYTNILISFFAAVAYGIVSGALMTPYAAMAPDLVKDYHGRTRLSNMRHLFQLISICFCVILFSRFYSGEEFLLNGWYRFTVILLAFVFTLPFVMLITQVPEVVHKSHTKNWFSAIKRLLKPFKLQPFRVYLVMNATMETVLIIIPVLFPFYLRFYLDSMNLLPLYALSLGIGAFGMIFLLMRFAKTLCKIKLYQTGVFLALFVVAGLWALPESGGQMAFILFTLLGMSIAAISSARLSMLTDLAHLASHRFRTSCEGVVVSVAKSMAKIFAGLCVFFLFQFTHFKPNESDVIVDGDFIKLLLLVPITLLLVIAMIASYYYQLNENKLSELTAEIFE